MNVKQTVGLGMLLGPIAIAITAIGGLHAFLIALGALGVCVWGAVAINLIDGGI
jgi:hypothetical protein